MEYKTHLKIVVFFGFSVLLISIVGYMSIEKLSFVDALYMTVITLTTVGFKEVKELSTEGRVFTVFIIFLGVGGIAYSLRVMVEFVLEEKIGERWRLKKMQRKEEKLNNHFIVCGYGDTGAEVCLEFEKRNIPFVVVEKDPEAIKKLQAKEFLYVEGNAEENEVLLAAGIERAKALLTALSSDAENVFVTLSAKALNPDVIVAASSHELQAEEKLKKAGADKVISPHIIGGRRLAAVVMKPKVVDFLDTVVSAGNLELEIEEIQVEENSEMIGRSIAEAKIKKISGAIIIAIVDNNRNFKINPSSAEKIGAREILIALGTTAQLGKLREMAKK